MSRLLAIDPGTSQSGWVILSHGIVQESGVVDNEAMLLKVMEAPADVLALEMIQSFGMAVGKEVFETCVWIGRFQQAWHTPKAVLKVYRKDVKMHLCGTPRAKDANIRQALLDKIGPQGVKAKPGPTYGVRSHAWAALAVAVTADETILRKMAAAA